MKVLNLISLTALFISFLIGNLIHSSDEENIIQSTDTHTKSCKAYTGYNLFKKRSCLKCVKECKEKDFSKFNQAIKDGKTRKSNLVDNCQHNCAVNYQPKSYH